MGTCDDMLSEEAPVVPRGLRHIRTMRDTWRKRDKGAKKRQDYAGVVRRCGVTAPSTRQQAAKGTKSFRAWVFSKKPAERLPQKQLLVKRSKEPAVDLFDEENELIVLTDLPGVSEQHVRISAENDLLVIEGVSGGPLGNVHYYKEVILPCEVRRDCDASLAV